MIERKALINSYADEVYVQKYIREGASLNPEALMQWEAKLAGEFLTQRVIPSMPEKNATCEFIANYVDIFASRSLR
jgi:hypothetical protein